MADALPAELTPAAINALADELAQETDAILAVSLCDLLLANRCDLANALYNRALEARQDYRGAALLPVHACLRALSAFAADPRRTDAHALARAILGRPPQPRLIAVGGLSGSGKSTLARSLAARLSPPLGAVWLRTDGIRKRLFGLPPEARLGEDAYLPAISGKVYRRLSCTAQFLLEQGLTVVAEATFTRRPSRNAMEKIAANAGAPFHGFWLEAPIETLMARADARAAAPGNPDASDATSAIVALQADDVRGQILWHRLATDRPPEAILADALALLSE